MKRTHPIFQRTHVIFSGSDSYGQGEHKIVEFIRDFRKDPRQDPLTTHLIYSNDADVIILGTMTRAKYVAIIKDSFGGFEGQVKTILQRKEEFDEPKYDYIFLNLLKEYILLETRLREDDPFTNQFLDGLFFCVSMCGNDFLPRMPSLFI